MRGYRESIARQFRDLFHKEPVIVRSPGRINLIGEHTDYNDGFVLPAAIDKYVYAAAALSDEPLVSLFSVHHDERLDIPLDEITPEKNHWSNYVLGVVHQLRKRGHDIGAFQMVIDGDLPVGAGLSSSAALGCAVCKVLDDLFGLELSEDDIIGVTQAAEHEFAGVQCGIMDMFASVRGKKNHGLLLDCRSGQYKEIPLELNGYSLVLLNTNVKHTLASSAYNQRREQCLAGLQLVQRHIPSIHSLRAVTTEHLIEYVHDPVLHQRCRFVLEENERVQRAATCLRNGDIRGLGCELFRSHEGLTHDYDVSCAELDWLVASVRMRRDVAGARMMGGGFGGCTINLVRDQSVNRFIDELLESYERFMGITLSAYVVQTADGTEMLSLPLNV